MKHLLGLTLISSVLLVAGCTTESTTNISNYEGSSTVTNRYDKELAAQKRVTAAQAYLRNSNLERAKFHLDKAAEHMDDYPDLHFTLGYYYQLTQDFKLADKAFRKALDLDSKNPEYKNGYGQFLCGRERFEEAYEYFQSAIKTPTYSNVAQAYVNAGNCKRKDNKLDDAVEFYRKALNINSKLPDALLEMAQYEFDKERYSRTRNYLSRYRDVARHTPRSLWLGLRAEHYLGDKDAVASYSLQLENMYPDSKETLEYLESRERWQ